MTANIHYVGFKSKAIVREYSFHLRESSIEPQEITFTILNEAFRSHGLRYQDAPDLPLLTEAASRDGQLRGQSTENALPDQWNRTG